jgi:hypothetical protein
MSTFDIIFWGLLLVALIVSGRYASKREKKFAVTKDKFISRYGFEENGAVYRELHKHGFSLLSRSDDDYEITNVISKLGEKEDFFIFDFLHTPKYVDKSTAGKQATLRAVLIQFKIKELYNFELIPENIFEKIKQIFGSTDIDFDEYQQFSKRYVLKGEDQALIRKRFPKSLVKKLETKKGVCIEARESCLLTYNLGEGEFADYEYLYKDAMLFNRCLR